MSITQDVVEIARGLSEGAVIPYLGPGIYGEVPFPATIPELAEELARKVTVPGKLRGRLWESAQYIENFKHRKTLVHFMNELYRPSAGSVPVLEMLTGIPDLPLIVDSWYDRTLPSLLPAGKVQIVGTSKSDNPYGWYRYYRKQEDGSFETLDTADVSTVRLYKPFGSVIPSADFVVSDADFVEILTEIDIQTPIPLQVQQLRSNRRFLFLGCAFNNQTSRIFARQIMKRSSDRHWMVLDREPTSKEARFLNELNIQVIPAGLDREFLPALRQELQGMGTLSSLGEVIHG